MEDVLTVLQTNIQQKRSGLLTGLSVVGRGFLLAELGQRCPRIVSLVAGEKQAYDLKQSLEAFGASNVELFLAHDVVFSRETLDTADVQQMAVLQKFLQGAEAYHLITTPGSWLYFLLDRRQLQQSSVTIQTGQELVMRELISGLIQNGYQRTALVTCPGEIVIRGGIVDVFPVGADHPCRVEWFGDTVESMRWFNPEDQCSFGPEASLTIPPVSVRGGASTLFNYLSADTVVFFDEPHTFYQEYDRQHQRTQQYFLEMLREDQTYEPAVLLPRVQLENLLRPCAVIYHAYFSTALEGVSLAFSRHVTCQDMEPFFRRYEALADRANTWRNKGYQIFLFIDQPVFLDNMKAFLLDQGVSGVQYRRASLDQGFISPTLGVAVVTEFDLRGKSGPSEPAEAKNTRTPLLLLEDLNIGEYVVHEQYGIGVFHGVAYDTIDGVTKEYILLQYAGSDKLYLPVEKLYLLHRYSSTGESAPRLHKLGGSEWERTRKKVVKAVQDMADDLIQLYAARQKIAGFAFAADTAWQTQFEDDFPYQETPGQLTAIADVKRDMESARPMDRLICGDVGYGKTEVAMRAAFKALMDGKQTAILVPTTILAEQHYRNFGQRFSPYPANISVLSRFRPASEQKQTLKALENGAVDIVIATHRLLSKDVSFHDLGLLVIDEEHRFGVAQKEKLKALRRQVDVLSLSATPIPRSLHMAMTGIRDLSVIDTPPPNRYPVTTYVMEYEPEVIREAIRFELQRGGQVFFVHNRVQDILSVRSELARLTPEARIAVGHGQMPETELEEAILAFQEQKFDVFLCTTIIESGLDMPNVNTLIVHRADYMGLAQLYQLRGRVGRSHTMAYAYITYQPDRSVTETAQKRLNALRDFHELGSGMKIALRDLEIRGAGNLLGSEQHGHIHAVGFDLYCRILEEETSKRRGEPALLAPHTAMDIDLDSYIPESYIADAGARMRIYRQLLMAARLEDLTALRQEMEDRFGPIPAVVESFWQISRLRVLAQGKQIKGIRHKQGKLYLTLDFERMVELAQYDFGRKVKVVDEQTLLIETVQGAPLTELEQVLAVI